MDTLGNLAQQSGGDLFVGGELLQVDGNQELLSLGVNITDIDTTLVVEQDPVTLCSALVFWVPVKQGIQSLDPCGNQRPGSWAAGSAKFWMQGQAVSSQYWGLTSRTELMQT